MRLCKALTVVATATWCLCGADAVAASRRALLLTEMPDTVALQGAEARVRTALASHIVDERTTVRITQQARELGLGCSTLDEQCAAGFGQLAGVEEVIAVVVRPMAGGTLVKVMRIAASSARIVDVTMGRLGEVAGDGGLAIEAIAANLVSTTKKPAAVPIGVVAPSADLPLRVDDVRASVNDGVVWLLPGPHSIGIIGETSTLQIVVTDRGEPVSVTLSTAVPASSLLASSPSSSPSASSPTASSSASAIVADGSAPWAALGLGGVGVAVVGGMAWLGADAWLGAELSSPSRLQASERAVGEAIGVVGVVARGAGAMAAVAAVGAGVLWSEP